MSKCKIVIIGGASASGKTALAQWLKTRAETQGKRSRVITLDDFYKPRPNGVRACKTDDEPAAFDFALYLKMVNDLSQGQQAQKPNFDYARKTRAETGETINPDDYDVIFIEGILALHGLDQNPDLITIYVEPESYPTLIYNRAVRDALGQWCDPVETTKKRELTAGVRDGFFNHILRTKSAADVRITNPHRSTIDPQDLNQLNELLTEKESIRIALQTEQDDGLASQLTIQLAALREKIEPIQKAIKATLIEPDFNANPDVKELLKVLEPVEESAAQLN